MIIKSPWIKSTLILIPGLLFITTNYFITNYNKLPKLFGLSQRINIPCFVVFVILTLILLYIISKRCDDNKTDGSSVFFIMILYLFISAISCISYLVYDTLTHNSIFYHGLYNNFIFYYSLHNAAVIVVLLVPIFNSN